MKTIIVALVTAALVLVVLNTGLTPWRIVKGTTASTAASPTNSPAPIIIRHAAAPPDHSATDHAGDWMRDPNYRTSLEKNTVVGRPEPAASRDAHSRP